MDSAEELAANFHGESVPPELARLVVFDVAAEGPYAEGFELLATNGDELTSWSTDPAFAERLFVFARATSSDSLYAIWRADPRAALVDSPVVIFGDEGGAHVVAGDVPELLQLLSFDAEPAVDWDEVSFFKDYGDYEPSDESDRYVQWLSDELGLDAVTDPDAIVARAQATYGEAFSCWMAPYLPE